MSAVNKSLDCCVISIIQHRSCCHIISTGLDSSVVEIESICRQISSDCHSRCVFTVSLTNIQRRGIYRRIEICRAVIYTNVSARSNSIVIVCRSATLSQIRSSNSIVECRRAVIYSQRITNRNRSVCIDGSAININIILSNVIAKIDHPCVGSCFCSFFTCFRVNNSFGIRSADCGCTGTCDSTCEGYRFFVSSLQF